MFDPGELHSLSRSIHSLTHFTIHDCPLVCCRAVAAMVRANPSLSTLSLSGTTYRLFSSEPLSTVLRLSSRKLQTLSLAGLPSFRPGMLAGCSSLESLTLQRAEGSLEGLLAMLVRVVEARGGAEREKARAVARLSTAAAAVGTSGILSAQLIGEEEEEDGELGEDTLLFIGYEEYSAAATPNAVHNGTVESEAGAGEAVTVMSREELLVVLDRLLGQLRLRLSFMHETADSLLQWENNVDWTEGLSAAAVEAPAAAVPGVQEEGAQREEGQGRRRNGESCSISAAAKAHQGSERATPVEVICPCLASLVLKNIQFSPAFEPAWLPGYLPSTSPLLVTVSRTPPCSTFRPSTSLLSPGSTPSASPSQQRWSFESIALAAVFGGLRRLAVVHCGGVGEEQLTDALLLSCPLPSLTHATLVSCTQVTAAGVAGLLGSFPGLRYLKVEEEKVPERARRKLLRAGVVVRGCEFDVGPGCGPLCKAHRCSKVLR
ncbi:unnamed protein product [Closterium sp. Yama58-4]|nr:unnamed protein product [Closterium sp. Yama58-4]